MPAPISRLLFGLPLVITAVLPAITNAAEADPERLQELIGKLKAQIERAEEQRLADPWFLRDLRELIGDYEDPWRNEILYDDFSARGNTPAAPWQITAGEFLIEWRHGLRSVVEPSRQQTQTRREGEEVERLVGALLEQALGGGERGRATAEDPGYAAILAPVPFANAFAIDIELNSRAMERSGGSIEWGPYQGEDAASGYRLVYTPDPGVGLPALALHRFTPRGSSTLEFHDGPIDLQDGHTHELRWTRATDGMMTVLLDGEPLLQVRDRGFRDPFDGFAVINRGGDYAVREITIMGAD